jgi:hypothetical protein
MSVAHIELTPDDAVKELKAIKVHEQNIIADIQGGRWVHLQPGAREQAIAGHRRRIDALHAAIEALKP